MSHYKLIKSKTFCRLIPTLMFIIAITSIILTVFFMFVLQSTNAYKLDSEEFNVDHDDFRMEISGATSDQIANLDIDNVSLEDISNVFTTPQSPPQQQFETFLLKETINPTTNNHINTNNNTRNMKAYKIVSKEPIIRNSLVKIVMAPHNVLEKLSQPDDNNEKYATNGIDENGNAPIKEYGMDDSFDRELIRNGDGNDNVNVQVFSLESEEGNVGFMENNQTKQKKKLLHHDLNNIQIIAKSHQQPLNAISIDRKIPFDLMAKDKVRYNTNNERRESNDANEFKSMELESMELESMEIVPEIDSTVDMSIPTSLPEEETAQLPALPTTTEEMVIDSTYTEAEELLSNPTTSQNLIPTLIPEDVKSELSEEDRVATDLNDINHETALDDIEMSPVASQEISTENNVPLVLLRVLKNRTVLVDETLPQLKADQLSMETLSIPTIKRPIRPKKTTTTTTEAPTTYKAKPLPKKASMMDSYFKPKFDDVFFKPTTKTGLLDVETSKELAAKSKNIKRAIGDEGTFSSNIVRPSPIRPKGLGQLFPQETVEERAERLSGSMKRLMHAVQIFGHVDSYVTKRLRTGLKNVARIFDSVEDTRRRRSN